MSSDSSPSEPSLSPPDPTGPESANPSPDAEQEDDKVEELRRILLQSESIHLLSGTNVEGMSLNSGTIEQPPTFERWVRVPPEEEIHDEPFNLPEIASAQQSPVPASAPSSSQGPHTLSIPLGTQASANARSAEQVLAQDDLITGYELSVIRDREGEERVWVRVVTLDEEGAEQEVAMYPPEVFLNGAALLESIAELWE